MSKYVRINRSTEWEIGSLGFAVVPKDLNNSLTYKENIMVLKVGEQAPDFCLESHQSRKTCLRYFHGTRNVVLAFFPLAWTPV